MTVTTAARSEDVVSAGDAADAARDEAGEGWFEQAVRRHYRLVFSICYQVLGVAGDAEDAAQEAFLRAYRSRASPSWSKPMVSRRSAPLSPRFRSLWSGAGPPRTLPTVSCASHPTMTSSRGSNISSERGKRTASQS